MGTPEKIVEENWDLVMKVTAQMVKRYRFPDRIWADIESAAGLALWRAAQKWDGRGNIRGFLSQQMCWDIIDHVRIVSGREGSAKAERRSAQLSLDDNDAYTFTKNKFVPGADELLLADSTLSEILSVCPNDRHREAVVRTLLGQREREIAVHLGVSESRISQMLTKVRQLMEVKQEWPKRSHSLIVNWR